MNDTLKAIAASLLMEHGENRDIFERLFAVRLDRIRESPECRVVLMGRDPCGLLAPRLQVDDDERAELEMKEQQVDRELFFTDCDAVLPADERKTLAVFAAGCGKIKSAWGYVR